MFWRFILVVTVMGTVACETLVATPTAVLSTPSITAEDRLRLARWREQWVHWEHVDDMKEIGSQVAGDGEIDETELDLICGKVGAWRVQLEAARDYVVEYRRVEPKMVVDNLGLGNLQSEAEAGLDVVDETEKLCTGL